VNVHDFLQQRPCLEEIDGYLWGWRQLYGQPPAEVIGPIEKRRAELKTGKVLPTPYWKDRKYIYRKGKPPKIHPRFRHEVEMEHTETEWSPIDDDPRRSDEYATDNPSAQSQQTDKPGRKTLDRNKDRGRSKGKVRILHR
jgi:hypothetical protein